MGEGATASKKTRKQQRDEVMEKTLEASFSLFMEHGYKNTTISMISSRSGVNVGSIYNVFNDKEDIVSELLLRGYRRISDHGSGSNDLASKVAYPLAKEIRFAMSSPQASEVMGVAYSSPKVLDRLAEIQAIATQEYFTRYGYELDPAFINPRLHAINGAIGGILSAFCRDLELSMEESLRVILQMYCTLFSIPCFNMDSIIEETIRIVDEESTEVQTIMFG